MTPNSQDVSKGARLELDIMRYTNWDAPAPLIIVLEMNIKCMVIFSHLTSAKEVMFQFGLYVGSL